MILDLSIKGRASTRAACYQLVGLDLQMPTMPDTQHQNTVVPDVTVIPRSVSEGMHWALFVALPQQQQIGLCDSHFELKYETSHPSALQFLNHLRKVPESKDFPGLSGWLSLKLVQRAYTQQPNTSILSYLDINVAAAAMIDGALWRSSLDDFIYKFLEKKVYILNLSALNCTTPRREATWVLVLR